MKTSDFFYELPQELIAQTPMENRDRSRLFVYNRAADKIEHRQFFEVENYLKSGDVLVINNTKVIPARIYGRKNGSEGLIEFLLLKRISLTQWEAMVKPGRRLKPDAVVNFGNELSAKILAVLDEGLRVVEFSFNGVFEEILDRLGEMPLPHYITHKLENKERYNTVYAAHDGSAAAPTAGLHFTPELIERLKKKGVTFAEVLLHVGPGTFRPVKVEEISSHKMHSEYYEMPETAADVINKAKSEGRRVIAVGTTSVRVLESCANDSGFVAVGKGNTEIFIYPGYKFKITDALITNFHLPQSTLIMLVSAFTGREKTLGLYETAVKEKYRFFSFGDAMFIF